MYTECSHVARHSPGPGHKLHILLLPAAQPGQKENLPRGWDLPWLVTFSPPLPHIISDPMKSRLKLLANSENAENILVQKDKGTLLR